MKKLVTKYTIAIILGGALSTIALSLNGFFDTDVAIIQYKLLADAFSASTGDVKEARKRIGKIVKENDKCISMLND